VVVRCGAVASAYRVVPISNPHLPGLILEEEAVKKKDTGRDLGEEEKSDLKLVSFNCSYHHYQTNHHGMAWHGIASVVSRVNLEGNWFKKLLPKYHQLLRFNKF
jgi:hypothetical protein